MFRDVIPEIATIVIVMVDTIWYGGCLAEGGDLILILDKNTNCTSCIALDLIKLRTKSFEKVQSLSSELN